MSALRKIQLLSFPGCPHATATRTNLEAALRRAGRPPLWEEMDLTDPTVADRLVGYGSPTVLVNGQDVTGEAPHSGARQACRVDGAPTVERILAALSEVEPASDEDAGGAGKEDGP